MNNEFFQIFPRTKIISTIIVKSLFTFPETAMGVKVNAQEKPSEYTESVKV